MKKLHTRLVLLWLTIFSSQFSPGFGQQPPTAKVLIDCNYCAGQKIAINVTDVFSNGFSKLKETKVDTAGQATFSISVNDPLLAYITVGPGVLGQDSVYRLYLEPDQVLKLSIKDDKVHYTGQLSTVNEYLLESETITNKVWDVANTLAGQFRKFTQEEKGKVQESFHKQFAPLHQTITSDNRLSPHQKDLLIANNQLLIQWRMLELEGPDLKKLKEESSYEALHLLKELPINANYVKANLDTYRRVIDFEIRDNLYSTIYYALEKDGKADNEDTLAVLMDKAIRSSTRLAPIREFLLAKNISRSLVDHGLRAPIIQHFTRFREDYPDSPYTPTLEAIFDKYYELGEGKDARDFTAMDINGKEVRLLDLKGKVVYVDTWATWCGPCLAEFPHSKKMVEHYRGNDQVVFLFVSTDTDTKKWKSFVNSNKVPKGMHLNYNPASQKTSLNELYQMRGIPHYILIDKDGKIKANRAPRPSEKESYALIDGLLN